MRGTGYEGSWATYHFGVVHVVEGVLDDIVDDLLHLKSARNIIHIRPCCVELENPKVIYGWREDELQ